MISTILDRVQAHRIALHFTDAAFLTNWKSAATLRPASLSAPFFRQHLFILSVTVWLFSQYIKPFQYHCVGYGDLWSVITESLDDDKWFFSNKVFLIKVRTLFLDLMLLCITSADRTVLCDML